MNECLFMLFECSPGSRILCHHAVMKKFETQERIMMDGFFALTLCQLIVQPCCSASACSDITLD